jgi:tellurite resistance protein TerC
VISVRESVWLSLGYLLISLMFAVGIFYTRGADASTDFMTGYLIEKSLSIDNIFIFLLIFAHFQTPAQLQYKVLFWGILGALAMRFLLIIAGAVLIETFHWVIYIFGAFLVLTGIKMLVSVDTVPDLENNRIMRCARRLLPVATGDHDGRFFSREAGRLMVTPLLLVLILVEVVDVIFALDSVPAVFAITTDPFIVYTSNVFAILGLRALYFALAGVIHHFHYLKYALSLMLIFIGGKMLTNGILGEKFIPTEVALLVTAALLGGSIALSLLWPVERRWLRHPIVR